MKIGSFGFVFLTTLANIAFSASPPVAKTQAFDKNTFFTILKQGTIADMDRELLLIDGLPEPEKGAYGGALLMKKAGLLHKPKDKLAAFKSGRIRLETAIHADPANVEFRFLRLIIQEHAPKITKYGDNLKEDAEVVKKHFDQLSAGVQQVVKDYAKTSSVLNL